MTYAWDFGDGASSTDAATSHSYDTAGEYTVTLTVTNDYGSDSVNITITVLEDGQTPNHPQYLPIMMNE